MRSKVRTKRRPRRKKGGSSNSSSSSSSNKRCKPKSILNGYELAMTEFPVKVKPRKNLSCCAKRPIKTIRDVRKYYKPVQKDKKCKRNVDFESEDDIFEIPSRNSSFFYQEEPEPESDFQASPSKSRSKRKKRIPSFKKSNLLTSLLLARLATLDPVNHPDFSRGPDLVEFHSRPTWNPGEHNLAEYKRHLTRNQAEQKTVQRQLDNEREAMENKFQMDVMNPALRKYNLKKLNDSLLMEKNFYKKVAEPAIRKHNSKKSRGRSSNRNNKQYKGR